MYHSRAVQFSKPFQCSFSADVVKLFDEAWGEIEGDCPLYFRWFGYRRLIGYIKQVWVCFASKIYSNNLRIPFVRVKVERLTRNNYSGRKVMEVNLTPMLRTCVEHLKPKLKHLLPRDTVQSLYPANFSWTE